MMTLATVLSLCLSTAAATDDVLICFMSESSAQCRSMEPVLRRLVNDGYRIDAIDVAQRPDVARQFEVTQLPCFVLWSQGRAAARIDGPTSYDRLTQLFGAARPVPDGNSLSSAPPIAVPPAMARGQTPGRDSNPADPTTHDPRAAAERALRSTVRIRLEDSTGTSVGTGTIVDVHGDEALVVSCGHLFRELRPESRILVDLFLPGSGQAVVAELLDFDLKRDISVLAIRPGMAVQAARVGQLSYRPTRGDSVFSIGCDRGAPPSIRASQVTAINRYTERPNIEVAGAPVIGRSGGGLFSADGLLIGVCNAADPQDNEGIYAGLATVQWQLEAIGQRRLFDSATQEVAALPSPAATTAEPATKPGAVRPRAATSPGTPGEVGLSGPGEGGGEEFEVICVLRSRGSGGKPHETIVIPRASADLITRIKNESQNVLRAQSMP